MKKIVLMLLAVTLANTPSVAQEKLSALSILDRTSERMLTPGGISAHFTTTMFQGTQPQETISGTIDILGYAFDPEASALQKAIGQLHDGRWQRAELIAQRLAAKGMPGALEGAREVQQQRGDSGNAPARPHFAEFLVRAGHVRDHAEAFRKWLGSGKLGDVKQHWPSLEQTLTTLREAGAWISLAHPWQYDFTRSKRRRLVIDFVQGGGHALEVVNGMQPLEQVGGLSILAREFGLMASVGSDFHAPGDWSELGMYRALPDDLQPIWRHFEHEPDKSFAR